MTNSNSEFTPWAFRQSLRGIKLPKAEYRVAVELAEHAEVGKAAVWPSIKTLALHCALDTRAVERALSGLTKRGIITKGNGKSTRILVIQKPAELPVSTRTSAIHKPAELPVETGRITGHTPAELPDEYLKYEYKEDTDAIFASDGCSISKVDTEDPWGSPPEPDQGSGGRQVSEDEGVGPGTGSLCSPGDPQLLMTPTAEPPVGSPRGTPEKLVPLPPW